MGLARDVSTLLTGWRRAGGGVVELVSNDDGTIPVKMDSGAQITLVDGNGSPITDGIPVQVTVIGGSTGGGGSGATATPATPVDISGQIVAGGTAQQLAATSTSGQSVTLTNTSSGVLMVSETGTASGAAGDPVPPGATWSTTGYVFNAVSVWGATTAQTFRATRTPAPGGAAVGTATSASGSILAAGAAQTLTAAAAAGHLVTLTNTSSADMLVSETGTASASAGDLVPAGASWQSAGFVTNAISVWGGTAGQTFRSTVVTATAGTPAADTAGTAADLSGAITTGGTAQLLVAQESVGHAVALTNTSGADLRISEFGSAGAAVGDLVPNGATWTSSGYPQRITNAISIWGATTGQAYRATKV